MRNGRELVSDCYAAAQTGAEPLASPRLAALRAVPDLEGERSLSVAPHATEESASRRPNSTRFGRVRRVIVDEQGAVTAEYAIVIMAAVAFAGVLVAIIRSEQIRKMLVDLVENALGTGGKSTWVLGCVGERAGHGQCRVRSGAPRCAGRSRVGRWGSDALRPPVDPGLDERGNRSG